MGRSMIAEVQIGVVWCWAGGKSEAAIVAIASVTGSFGALGDDGREFESVSSKEGCTSIIIV